MTNILRDTTSHMVDFSWRYKHFRVILTVQLARKREPYFSLAITITKQIDKLGFYYKNYLEYNFCFA